MKWKSHMQTSQGKKNKISTVLKDQWWTIEKRIMFQEYWLTQTATSITALSTKDTPPFKDMNTQNAISGQNSLEKKPKFCSLFFNNLNLTSSHLTVSLYQDVNKFLFQPILLSPLAITIYYQIDAFQQINDKSPETSNLIATSWHSYAFTYNKQEAKYHKSVPHQCLFHSGRSQHDWHPIMNFESGNE